MNCADKVPMTDREGAVDESPPLELSMDDVVEGTGDLPEVAVGRGGSIAPTSHPDARPAPYIGPYQLLARFPSSAAGDVFLGIRRTEFGYSRRAVVKVVWHRDDSFEERRRALLDEARAVAALDHPNIVKMIDSGVGAYGAYLALEFVNGVDLQRVLGALRKRKVRLPVPLSVYMVAQILRGLHHAHDATDAAGIPMNLVHRDANPSNILVARTGHVVLADFGIVRMANRYQQHTAPDLVKGKFRYLAPEYITHREVDRRVDVYGMGVVLYECLTGGPWTLPRSADAMKRIVTDGLPIDQLAEYEVPDTVRNLVGIAVARAPDLRFQTAFEMAEALENYLSREGMFVSPASVAEFLQPCGVFEVLNRAFSETAVA